MVKRGTYTLLLAALLLMGVTAVPANASEDLTGSVTITGGGWGHAIGLSQFGARAQAEAGRSAAQILAYYYSGSQLGQTGQGNVTGHPDPLWIGMVQNRTSVPFSNDAGSAATLIVRRGSNRTQIGSLAPGQTGALTRSGANCTIRLHNTTLASECAVDIDWSYNTSSPATTVRTASPHGSSDIVLRRGGLRIRPHPTTSVLHSSLRIGLEEYLYGIQEVPSSWHREALRTQAIAARSYAVERSLARNSTGNLPNSVRQRDCWCHLYATTADQHYTGWVAETANWRAAVDATARTVVTHAEVNHRAIPTFYSSSTGGRTENNEDIWGGTPRAYLRSVDDHWSGDPRAANPFADWTVKLDYRTFANRLGFDLVQSIQIPSRYVSGTPTSIRVTGVSGNQVVTRSYAATQFRTLFGLRSHQIRTITLVQPAPLEWFAGDFTGDGKSDLALFDKASGIWRVGRSTGSSFVLEVWNRYSTGSGWTHLVGDANGDGRDDIISYHAPTGGWWVATSTGSAFQTSRWNTFSTTSGWATHLVGDFTGNGSDDVVSYHAPTGRWWVSRSTGSAFRSELWNTFSTKTGWATHLVGDFNGDKRDDVVSYHAATGGWWVATSTGSAFQTSRWNTFSTKTGWATHLVGDFNGDGSDDVVSYHAPTGRWWVGRSTGSAFRSELWNTFSTATGWQEHLVGDVTGDGRDDIVSYHPGNGSWWVGRSTGTSFRSERWNTYTTPSGWQPLIARNFTGTGPADVFTYHEASGGLWVNRSSGSSFTSSRWLLLQ